MSAFKPHRWSRKDLVAIRDLSAAEIVQVLDAHREANHVVGDAYLQAPLGRDRRMGHRDRVADQCFDATQAFGERQQADAIEHGARSFEGAHLKGK